jgi:hypothetical protein
MTKHQHANRQTQQRAPGRGANRERRSRLNSRKHGLTAKMLIIVAENAADFDQLRAELMDEHDPQSALECELVERLAGILWRLRRVPFFEAAILDARQDQVWSYVGSRESEQQDGEEEDEEAADWEASVRFGKALLNDARNDALGKLGRHETTLMHALTRTLQMLVLLQEKRASKSEPVMVEAVALPTAA